MFREKRGSSIGGEERGKKAMAGDPSLRVGKKKRLRFFEGLREWLSGQAFSEGKTR